MENKSRSKGHACQKNSDHGDWHRKCKMWAHTHKKSKTHQKMLSKEIEFCLQPRERTAIREPADSHQRDPCHASNTWNSSLIRLWCLYHKICDKFSQLKLKMDTHGKNDVRHKHQSQNLHLALLSLLKSCCSAKTDFSTNASIKYSSMW